MKKTIPRDKSYIEKKKQLLEILNETIKMVEGDDIQVYESMVDIWQGNELDPLQDPWEIAKYRSTGGITIDINIRLFKPNQS